MLLYNLSLRSSTLSRDQGSGMPEGICVSGLIGRSGSLCTVARAMGLHMAIWKPIYMGSEGKYRMGQIEGMIED